MTVRSVLTFACPSCGRTFQVPESVISAEGARGRCKGCGAGLALHLDGTVQVLSPTAPSPAASAPPAQEPAPPPPPVPLGPDPKQERIWYLRLQNPSALLGPGPHSLEELGELILREEVVEEDHARVDMGTWLPLRAYPALEPYWTDRNMRHREKHGDEDHCAVHRDREPLYMCLKCKNFLCKDCVVNKPVIEGGAPRMLCDACEWETKPVPKKSGLKNMLPGFFGKKS